MGVTSRYRNAWEGFWREAPDERGAVMWDAEPEVTASRHLPLFEPHVADHALPLLDVGCGNGTQTLFLAGRFPRALGVDLSAAAVEHARRQDTGGRAEFRQLDAADKDAVQGLRAELGDVNLYMRGVLHQCDPADRQPLADGIATLLGTRGRAFVVELSSQARPLLMGLAKGPSGPPAKLRPILAHGIAPGEVADEAIPEFFHAAGLTVLVSGSLPLITTEYAPDGSLIELPSTWAVLGH